MTDRIDLPMVCTCGDELRAEGEALYQRVKDGLAKGSEELSARNVDDRGFFDALIASLLWDHRAEVQWIVGDQWFGVAVQWDDADGNTGRVTCECDSPLLGLAGIWEWFQAGRSEVTR